MPGPKKITLPDEPNREYVEVVAETARVKVGNEFVGNVRRGDRLPGVQERLINLSGEYRLTPQWSFGANLRAYSGQYLAGDENNADRYGALPGYGVVSLDLHYRPSRALAFFASVDNLFDRRYVNGGLLSTNVFDTPGRLIDTTGPGTPTLFVAPGAPRSFLLGVSYAFGGAAADDD